jgi:hypothetical protein
MQWLPFLHNACEIKAMTFTQNGAELLRIRKAWRTCGSERPQRILVPGRGTHTALLFTRNDCLAGLVFRMECTSVQWGVFCLHEMTGWTHVQNGMHLSSVRCLSAVTTNELAKRVKLHNNIVRKSHKINTCQNGESALSSRGVTTGSQRRVAEILVCLLASPCLHQ